MSPVPWIAVFLGSIIVGVAFVATLSLERRHEPLALLAGVASIVVATRGIFVVAEATRRPDLVAAAIALSLASLVGGYALAASLLAPGTQRPDPSALGELAPVAEDRPTVLVLACSEPDRYRPSAVSRDLQRLAGTGMPEALGITPFLYGAQKARYRAIGGRSPALHQAQALTERLRDLLGDEAQRVSLVSCLGKDTLPRAVAEVAAEGARTIVVSTLSVGESYVIERAKSAVDTLRPKRHGVRIAYAPPLWSSASLASFVAGRIIGACDDPQATGVALIAQGQPEVWANASPRFEEQENGFLNRVRALLVDHGIPKENVRVCFAEWRTPDITETVRHLAAIGCKRVIASPACIPFDSTATILDLQVAVRQARVDEHVSAITLGAWGDGPEIATVLQEAVRSAMSDL